MVGLQSSKVLGEECIWSDRVGNVFGNFYHINTNLFFRVVTMSQGHNKTECSLLIRPPLENWGCSNISVSLSLSFYCLRCQWACLASAWSIAQTELMHNVLAVLRTYPWFFTMPSLFSHAVNMTPHKWKWENQVISGGDSLVFSEQHWWELQFYCLATY